MTILHFTVADDDVLRRTTGKAALTALATVVVTSRLDGNTVVSGVEETVLYHDTVATLGVAAVAVRTVVVDMYATNGDVLTQQRMNDPEGRAQQRDILDENAVTLVGTDELRTQTILRTEAALVHVDAVFSSLQQALTGTVPLMHLHALLETETGIADPRPPRLIGTAAIDGSLTRDGDVRLLIGIDAG